MPSGGFGIKVTRDDLSARVRDMVKITTHPAPILRAIGTELVSLTKRAFRDPSLRQTPWPNKRGGGASNLIDKGMLLSSIRLSSYDDKDVTIASDRVQAAIMQLGGVIKPVNKDFLVFTIGGRTIFAKAVTMPPRPYFPFTRNGQLADVAKEPVGKVALAALSKAAGGTA